MAQSFKLQFKLLPVLSLIVIFSTLFSTTNSFAQEYKYPELHVVPRASDRLKIESSWEIKNRYKMFRSYQVSALMTLIAGAQAFSDVDVREDEKELSPIIATATGVFWLGATYWLGAKSLPYTRGLKKINRMKGNSKRDQLTKERLAEEEINEAASFAKKLRWLSFATNFLAGVYVSTMADTKSTAESLGAIAALASLSPFVFTHHYETVAAEQERYKKKIYGPVASASPLWNPFTRKINMGFTVSMKF